MGMKKTLLAVGWLASSMFAPSDAASQSPSGWDPSGNFWFTVCGSKGQLEEAVCTAHIAGLRGAFEMSADYYKIEKKRHLYCVADDVTLQQSIDVFVEFLRDNPKLRNNTSRVLFAVAMIKAFPCQ